VVLIFKAPGLASYCPNEIVGLLTLQTLA